MRRIFPEPAKLAESIAARSITVPFPVHFVGSLIRQLEYIQATYGYDMTHNILALLKAEQRYRDDIAYD